MPSLVLTWAVAVQAGSDLISDAVYALSAM